MHRATRSIAVLGGLVLALALALPAYADPGAPNGSGNASDPPGNNGTIKIHAADSETEPIIANEPHPGDTFHVHGFFFDASSTGTWTIVAWPPTGDGTTVVASGTWSASATGEWRTAVLNLPCGHYKAFAKQDGAPGGQKQKVFWVGTCATPGVTPTATPTPTPSPTPTPTPTLTVPTGGPTATPIPTQLGFEQPPMGGVSPIVETGAPATAVQGAEQAPVPVAGQQPAQAQPQQARGQLAQAGNAQVPVVVGGLPSTSTAAAPPPAGLLLLIGPLGALLWRRIRR